MIFLNSLKNYQKNIDIGISLCYNFERKSGNTLKRNSKHPKHYREISVGARYYVEFVEYHRRVAATK